MSQQAGPHRPKHSPQSLRRRSDKRPDRVEIAPEQLVEAVEYAEKLSQAKMGELGRTLKELDIYIYIHVYLIHAIEQVVGAH